MSDLYDPLQRAAVQAEGARKLQQQSGSDPLSRATEKIEPIQSHIEAQKKKFADLPPMASWQYDQYEQVLPAIATSDDPEGLQERFNSAMIMSKLFDQPIADVYQNLDAYCEKFTGKAFTPKTSMRAIADAASMGIESIKYNSLGAKLKAAGGFDAEISKQLIESRKRLESLQDNVPRPWVVDAIKFGAQSLPYTALSISAGFATGGLASGVLGATGAGSMLFSAVKAGATMLGSGAASYEMMEGSEYADLRAAGVRHDIAAPMSSISALVQAGVEVGLGGVTARLGKGVGVKLPSITEAVTKKLFVSGRIGALAKAAMDYGMDAVEEGGEEFFQSITSSISLEISAQLQKEGVDRETGEEVAAKAIENFKGGFMGALILGVPATATNLRGNVAESKRVADLARTFDQQTFTEQAGKMNLSLLEGMDETKKTETLTAIWNAQQARKGKQSDTKIDKKIIDMTGPSAARPGPARRLDDGSLRVQVVDKGTTTDLTEEAKMLIGDPKSSAKYGEVRYLLDGDTVVIDDVSAASYLSDKSEVVHDAIVEIGAQHPGFALEWKPANPEQEAIRDRIISENPRGREAGLQWFETNSDLSQTRRSAVVGKAIRQSFRNLSDNEVQAATSIVYETARSLGFRPEDVVGKSLELTTYAEIQKRPELAAQIAEARRGDFAAQGVTKESGATLFTQGGQIVGLSKASKEFERGMQAVIYAAENANFSTFTHEWFHFIDVAYIGRSETHRNLFEQALGKRYDDLTSQDREQLAYSFEQYLKDGQAPSEGLKDLFRRAAQAMSRVISAIGRTMTISPALRQGYDALFKDKSQLAEDVRTEAVKTGSVGREAVQGSSDSKNTHEVLFAENGARKSLRNAPIEKISSVKPKQPSNDLDEVYRMVGEVRKEFTEWANQIAEKYGGRIKPRDDLKKRDRAERKITDTEGAECVLDLDGKTLILDELDDVFRATSEIIKLPEVVRSKDRYFKPGFGNYRDMLLNVKMSNGAIVELQINVPKMLQAKDDAGHLLYEIADEVKTSKEKGKVSPEVAEEISRITESGMTKVYDAAYDAILSGAMLKASSLDITEQLGAISYQLQEEGAGSSVLSEKTRKKSNDLIASGRSSQSTNLSEGSSNNGTSIDGISASTSSISDKGPLFQYLPPDSEEFKAWFGDSKVSNAQGEPIVVYHGSPDARGIVGKDGRFSTLLERFNGTDKDALYFFTDDKSVALTYADDHRAFDYQNAEPAVVPVYLSIQNPLIVDANGGKWGGPKGQKSVVEQARQEGRDGIIIHNTVDTYNVTGKRMSDVFVAFQPTQIKSVDNRGTWNRNDPRILFQLTDAETDAEARTFDTWQEWRDYVETMDGEAKPESGADDAWYKSRWEQANGIIRNEQGIQEKEVPELTTEQIDEKFIQKLSEGKELEKFLEAIYEADNLDETFNAQDEEESLAREEARALKDRIDRELHPTLKNNAVRVGYSGRHLTPTARKSILTLIERGSRLYRNLYVDLTGDAEFSALAEKEIDTMPEIQDTEDKGISIVDRMNLVRKTKSERIRKQLMNGELVPDDIRLLIDELDKEKADLSSKLREAEKEIDEDRQTFTRNERTFVEQKEKIAGLTKEAARNAREIVAVEKKLAALRVRKDQVSAARREKLTAGYEKKLDTLRGKLAGIRGELAQTKAAGREAMSSARAEATLQKRRAVEKIKEQLRQKEEQRREAAKIIQYKRKIITHIMQEPSKNIWYEDAQKIREIQRVIDPKVRKATVKWEGETYEIQAFREKALHDGVTGLLSPSIIRRLFSKSIDEWTVAQLEEMSAEVDRLRSVGRSTWAEKVNERKMEMWNDQDAALRFHSEDPDLSFASAAGSKERREELKKKDSVFKKIATTTWTLSRIADWLDGGNGIHTRLLVNEERKSYAEKMDNYDRRVQRIQALMKEKGVDVRKLYETEHRIAGIGPSGSDVTYTTSDLMYIYIGMRDRNTKEAIIYGNLMDQGERSSWDDHTLEVMGREKIQTLEGSIRGMLTDAEKEIAEEISRDFRDEFGRLNDIFLNEFNLVMKKVDSYVPMIRSDVTASGEKHEEAQAEELLNVAGVSIKRTPDKGFTCQRVKISPRGQRAIKLDLYGTWMDAVERQEHFAAYTRYIRKLNGIYKDAQSSNSRMIRHMITQTKGAAVMQRIDQEINALANPQSFRDDQLVNKMVRTLRGNLGAAYLGWKTSSILKQAVTSPAPYLSYVSPLDMASSAMEYASNPKAMDDSIRSKSAIMRHRVSNPIIEAVKRARKESKGEKGLAWLQDMGMKGLEAVDWVSVATGWNAVYKKELLRGASEDEAVSKADDITLKCQPSAREQDLSPLFKTNSEAMKLITQFQTALNVIWNQFSYDLPAAVKRGQWGFVVRMTSSYAIAGIALGLLTEGLIGGDDDDEDKRLAKLAYWSFTQATDSIPLLGSGITEVMKRAITGDKKPFYQSSMLPAAEQLISAAGNVTEGKWGKAAENFAAGVGTGFGLPVSGAKEAAAVVGGDPERLMGRRK